MSPVLRKKAVTDLKGSLGNEKRFKELRHTYNSVSTTLRCSKFILNGSSVAELITLNLVAGVRESNYVFMGPTELKGPRKESQESLRTGFNKPTFLELASVSAPVRERL